MVMGYPRPLYVAAGDARKLKTFLREEETWLT
jgi:hypothetical protein